MITRVVKLTFREECIDEFLSLFEESKSYISSRKGNKYLALMKDVNANNIFFTISQWENLSDLDAYRNSSYFITLWTKTKSLFESKAEAWSLEQIQSQGLWHN